METVNKVSRVVQFPSAMTFASQAALLRSFSAFHHGDSTFHDGIEFSNPIKAFFLLTSQKASLANKTKLFPSEFPSLNRAFRRVPKHLCFFVVLKVPHRRSPARDEGLKTSPQEMPLFQPFRMPNVLLSDQLKRQNLL